MATVITEECINCGACEPECPNTAIYQGGVEFELNGATVPALSGDFFYIVPEKCTECVGFFDEEACAAVCPVDCCIPDPERPESEAALLERAKVIHPGTAFAEDFPSRFKDGGGTAAPAPAGDAPAAAPIAAAPVAVAAAPAAPTATSLDDFDVPVPCESCGGEYSVGFRFLAPGTVLRCPHCGVSFSPTQQMFLLVSRRLDSYADTVNSEIDRHTEAVKVETRNFETTTDSIERDVTNDVRQIMEGLTEAPKRSMFG